MIWAEVASTQVQQCRDPKNNTKVVLFPSVKDLVLGSEIRELIKESRKGNPVNVPDIVLIISVSFFRVHI